MKGAHCKGCTLPHFTPECCHLETAELSVQLSDSDGMKDRDCSVAVTLLYDEVAPGNTHGRTEHFHNSPPAPPP